MSKVEAYIQGWLTGDLDMIQDACAGDFVYDDAVDGRVTKAQFPEYYGAHPGDGDFDDIVVKEADGVETGFAWWHWTPEGSTSEQTGCMWLKADADGLHSAQLAYHKR
jgi:hypothetical protein